MDKKPFYITTTLPYVNAPLHLGHAVEFIRADIIARWKKLEGNDVFFNTGTDEHGIKIYQAAEKTGKSPKDFVDEYAGDFKKALIAFGISEDAHIVRTTDAHHEKAAQEFWKICKKNGYIYKKAYKVKYCVGCELEKTDSELVDGKCPIHPNLEIEIIDEENYFFKFSEFQKPLLTFYKENKDFVIPDFRFNEIKAFVERGLEDFSISRLKSKMSWGVPVPDDADHVMYVWFDALVSYISVLGWPEDKKMFEKFWNKKTPSVQYCGKDNLRQQSAMWQAMLMAAGLPNTHTIVVNGFVTAEGGLKMSKSLGNSVNPIDLVNECGTDALRYFVAREISPFEDSPFTMERFKEAYNSGLANGLGNLVSRSMKMQTLYGNSFPLISKDEARNKLHDKDIYHGDFDRYDLKAVTDHIWNRVQWLDEFIQKTEPYKKIKTNETQAKKDIKELIEKLWIIAI
ncbi:MAG TPA: methionine--tRNA ligase, partial [Candidatus Paceibacterota bacterium]|nr:methionine--tRNA ligase [Candidatus Paceibacterota bacterium]